MYLSFILGERMAIIVLPKNSLGRVVPCDSIYYSLNHLIRKQYLSKTLGREGRFTWCFYVPISGGDAFTCSLS